MKSFDLLDAIGSIDEKYVNRSMQGENKKVRHLKFGYIAACLAIIMGVSIMGVSVVAEAKEYNEAVEFFENNGLSTAGLSREDVKEVYRDITTSHFTYQKTAEVISKSVKGIELYQDEPTPENLAKVWYNSKQISGISYNIDYNEKTDKKTGAIITDKSIVECYLKEKLLWSVDVPYMWVQESIYTSFGTILSGHNTQNSNLPMLACIDENGKILWEKKINHNYEYEYIQAVIDNMDGTVAVFSKADSEYLCLSRYNKDGEEISFEKNAVGRAYIKNAVLMGDEYFVQISDAVEHETAHIIKLDLNGKMIDSFTYEGDDCEYFITDMAEFGGNVYLSAYSVPKQNDGGGRHEIANILDYVFKKENWEISDEELTTLVRDNYTAVLLLCDKRGGAPETFYSIKGSMGGELNINDKGQLVWNVESIETTFFSPATSSFTIGGSCRVFRYTFDFNGELVNKEDTNEAVPYRR